MKNNLFERYHCQVALPGFGEEAQQRLTKARVLIVGAGGLGCPSAQYLAAAGIGSIGIADDDVISLSNLHRQILFAPEDVGLKKAVVACEKLQRQNPLIKLTPYDLRVTSFNVMRLIEEFDLVIEGTDNFETKCLLSDACVLAGKPLVYGAIYQYEGQVAVWNVSQEDETYSPHYRDAFPDVEKAQVPNCAEGGVIPTLAGIVGCMQANEAIKYLTHSEGLLKGKLWMMDVRDGSTRIISLGKTSRTRIDSLPQAISTIAIDELQEEQTAYELLDVRTEDEHRAFNIGGQNIPLERLSDTLDTLSFSRPIVCYCSSGKRSHLATRLIKGRFPEARVFSLKNGLEKI
jgi:adenylyltransferase/sulfurtransferase